MNFWIAPGALSGGRCVIDAEKVREMVDDIRLNLPDEIKQAKAIVKDRSEILSSAKTEAEAIVRKAEERARVMIAQDEVMKQAQSKATEIVTQAQTKSKEIRQASQEFSDEVLRKAEESLANSLSEVRQTRQALKAPSGSLPSRTIPVPSKGKSNTDLFRAAALTGGPVVRIGVFSGIPFQYIRRVVQFSDFLRKSAPKGWLFRRKMV